MDIEDTTEDGADVLLVVPDESPFKRPWGFFCAPGVCCTTPFFSRAIGKLHIDQLAELFDLDEQQRVALFEMLDYSDLPETIDDYDRHMIRMGKAEEILFRFSVRAMEAAATGDMALAAGVLAELSPYLDGAGVLTLQ